MRDNDLQSQIEIYRLNKMNKSFQKINENVKSDKEIPMTYYISTPPIDSLIDTVRQQRDSFFELERTELDISPSEYKQTKNRVIHFCNMLDIEIPQQE